MTCTRASFNILSGQIRQSRLQRSFFSLFLDCHSRLVPDTQHFLWCNWKMSYTLCSCIHRSLTVFRSPWLPSLLPELEADKVCVAGVCFVTLYFSCSSRLRMSAHVQVWLLEFWILPLSLLRSTLIPRMIFCVMYCRWTCLDLRTVDRILICR